MNSLSETKILNLQVPTENYKKKNVGDKSEESPRTNHFVCTLSACEIYHNNTTGVDESL